MLNLAEFVIFCTTRGSLFLWYCHINIACFNFHMYFCIALFHILCWLGIIWSQCFLVFRTGVLLSLHIVTLLIDPCLQCPPLIPASSVSLLHLWPPHLRPPYLPTSLISTLTLSGGGESWAGPGPRPISPSLAAMCSSPEIITPSQWHHSNASLMID